jgi:hypothetical protein
LNVNTVNDVFTLIFLPETSKNSLIFPLSADVRNR